MKSTQHNVQMLSSLCYSIGTSETEDISDWVRHYSVTCLSNAIQQSHRVSLACPSIAVHKHKAMVGGVLFLGLHKHIVDYILAPNFKNFLPTLPLTENMVKPIHLVLHGCLNFYFVLADVFYLLMLLVSATWLEFNQHLCSIIMYS